MICGSWDISSVSRQQGQTIRDGRSRWPGVKINTDAAFSDDSKQGSTSSIIRDHEGSTFFMHVSWKLWRAEIVSKSPCNWGSSEWWLRPIAYRWCNSGIRWRPSVRSSTPFFVRSVISDLPFKTFHSLLLAEIVIWSLMFSLSRFRPRILRRCGM
jgi:hypothetical protein